MLPYFILIAVILISQIKVHKRSNQTYKLFLMFVGLFIFAAIRGSGSGDYFNYLIFSKYVTNFGDVASKSIPMEIGFRFMSYINNILGFHEQTVIAAMNFISLLCTYKFIKKYSPDKVLSVLLFLPLFLQYDMHASRTAVAMGISLFSYPYLLERDLKKFVMWVALAATFHKSVFILLPMYFIAHIELDKVLGVLSIVGLAVLSQITSTTVIALNILRLMGLSSFASKVNAYMQSERFGYGFRIYDPRLLLVIGIYFVAKIVLDSSEKEQNILINYAWINALIMLFFIQHTALVTRLSAYFNIYTIISIPYIITILKQKSGIKLGGPMKIAFVYTYLLYIGALAWGMVDYKIFF